MKAKFGKVLEEIKAKTALDIDIFDIFGQIVASTCSNGQNFQYQQYSNSQFVENIFTDTQNNLTCFIINSATSQYIGMIKGSDVISRNYAYMVSSLIEETFSKSEENLSISDSFRAILFSEYSKYKIQKFVESKKIPIKDCFVLCINCKEQESGEVYNFLSNYIENAYDTATVVDKNTIAFIKFFDNENFESPAEIADNIVSNIRAELSIKVVVGLGSSTKDYTNLPKVYNESAVALKMGLSTNSKKSVFVYKEFVLAKIIEDLDRTVLESYMSILLDENARQVLKDKDMMETVDEFLNCNLNISEASRKMYMHRNTLIYRLDKIERATGLNIRNFSDAMTFKLIKLINQRRD